MAIAYRTPGVYREEVFLRPPEALPTGVPGFVGFALPVPGARALAKTPLLLNRAEEFGENLRVPAAGEGGPDFYLADAVSGFFANGGRRCFVVAMDPSGGGESALIEGISALGSVLDLDLVAVPDAMSLAEKDAIVRVQRAALAHCRVQGNRFAILDAYRGGDPDQVADEQRRDLIAGSSTPGGSGASTWAANAALYYPWVIRVVADGTTRAVPPCGHVAGIYARTDAAAGVFKTPANEELADVWDLEALVDEAQQARLNPKGVNCLRAFPGRGIRVWGARTLSDDPTWRHVNVRRLLLTVARWIDRNMTWATFEPNTPRLWIRVQRELSVYLLQLWRTGALKGTTAEQAFFVKCDVETNPAEGREAGALVTQLGLAPLAPAEFVVVRVVHRQTGVDLT